MNTNPKYCVVINSGDTSSSSSSSQPPPPQPTSITTIIPRNENSQRVFSKRFRVFIFREFLLRTYPVLLNGVSSGGQSKKPPTVLDVAGGAGTLSWILFNVNNINSIIVDPKTPNHRRLVKSVEFLLDHPEECALRSTEGVPTHQPLAKLIPCLVRTSCGSSDGNSSSERNKMMIFRPTSPSYMRIRVNSTLVDILRKVFTDAAQQTSSITSEDDGADNDSNNNLLLWDEYWKKASIVVTKSNVVYKTSNESSSVNDNCQILDSRHALEVFRSLDLLVGFHPDQATEAIIDLALLLKLPFAVVPCCVFPAEFPDRTMHGKRVRMYDELVEYLLMKHEKIRTTSLPFRATEFARKVVLYMLPEDFN